MFQTLKAVQNNKWWVHSSPLSGSVCVMLSLTVNICTNGTNCAKIILSGTVFPFHSFFDDAVCKSFWFLERILSGASGIAFYSCKWFICRILPCPKAAWIWQQVLVNFVTFGAGVLENSSEICLWSWLWLPQHFHKCCWQWIFNPSAYQNLVEIKRSPACKKSDFVRWLPLKCLGSSKMISGNLSSLSCSLKNQFIYIYILNK